MTEAAEIASRVVVVTRTKDRPVLLRRAMESVLSQSFQDWVHVVVNDGGDPVPVDWLAAEYRDNGWSLKKLIKTIAMSQTYRQASDVTGTLREADPRNLIQSRGSRFRLGAEAVRDQVLSVAGLLSS